MDTTPALVDTLKLQSILMNRIKPSPFQTRTDFSAQELQGLADSMKEGLIHPIRVRPVGDQFELVDGERRFRAAQLLGWVEIKALVEELPDKQSAFKGIIANAQRRDLNPIEQAKAYKRLADPPFNLSHEAVGQAVGIVNRENISRLIVMLEMPQEIQDLVAKGVITEGHTRSLRQIADTSQQILLAQKAAQEGWSVKETEKRAKALLAPSPAGTSRPLPKGRGHTAVGLPPLGEGGRHTSSDLDEGDQPYQFKLSGREVLVSARIPLDSDIDPELAKLKTALIQWLQAQKTHRSESRVPGSELTVPKPDPQISKPETQNAKPETGVQDAVTDAATQVVKDLAKNILGGLF